MKIFCSKCASTFDPANQRFDRITDGDIQFDFSVCPMCGARTVYRVTDPDLRTGISMYKEICEKIAERRLKRQPYSLAMEYHRNRLKEKNIQREKTLRDLHEARIAQINGGIVQ